MNCRESHDYSNIEALEFQLHTTECQTAQNSIDSQLNFPVETQWRLDALARA